PVAAIDHEDHTGPREDRRPADNVIKSFEDPQALLGHERCQAIGIMLPDDGTRFSARSGSQEPFLEHYNLARPTLAKRPGDGGSNHASANHDNVAAFFHGIRLAIIIVQRRPGDMGNDFRRHKNGQPGRCIGWRWHLAGAGDMAGRGTDTFFSSDWLVCDFGRLAESRATLRKKVSVPGQLGWLRSPAGWYRLRPYEPVC